MADEAAQKRIITHMNKEHTLELSHYLRHKAGLSARAASRPWLKSITLDSMTIAAGGLGGREFPVPFTPPLTAYSEARDRLVAMEDEARAALGLADVHIDGYTPPTSAAEVVVAATIAVYGVCYATLGAVTPANPRVWDLVQRFFPGGADEYRSVVRSIMPILLGIHVLETWYMSYARLPKYGVVTGTKTWWAWIASTMWEGFGCFTRIDRIAEEKRAQKAAKSH